MLQHQAVSNVSALKGCTYELRGPPRRRLRRWPRLATLDYAADRAEEAMWPVVEEHRWLWDA